VITASVERERGSVVQSRTMLWAAAAAVAPVDATRATMMLIDATCADTMSGDLNAAAESGRRAREVASDPDCSPAARQLATVTHEWVANRRGELRADQIGMEAAREAVGGAPDLPPTAVIAAELLWAGWYAQQLELAEPRASSAIDRAIVAARDHGALTILPYLLGQGAQLDFREGRWVRATARAAEAAELAGETGQLGERAWGLVNLAWVEAAQGRALDCRAHAARALDLATEAGAGALLIQVSATLGLLELGLGNFSAAAAELEHCRRQAEAIGHDHPNVLRFEPDLVEALAATGRRDEARLAMDRLRDAAERVGSPFGLAAAARCAGVLAPPGACGEYFEAALALHDRTPSPFERARTQLSYGERLRRGRERIAARAQLMPALSVFDELGAAPWADRVRRELAATGSTIGPRGDPAARATLTPQELRVALIIADGVTVHDAATQLFLSPKTVEAHLGRVYRKLGVHNRAQLVTQLARRARTA
jgi:DNA-binding CsgD family transcriptional regulator